MNAGVVTSDKMYYVNYYSGELSAPGRSVPRADSSLGAGAVKSFTFRAGTWSTDC